jgi:hypothetical protein
MAEREGSRGAGVAVVFFAATFAALFFFREGRPPLPEISVTKEAVKTVAAAPLPLKPAERIVLPKGWLEDFTSGQAAGALPNGWVVQGKPGTKPADFHIERDAKAGASFLHMEADKASASIIARLEGVDIRKTPYLRWRWRVKTLPEGADGRVRGRDDQAIGIYVGTGSTLSNKSVSYRWDTETPKDAEGNAAYGMGVIKVKWHTLRNRDDALDGRWIVEERNVTEDFEDAWGFYPQEIYLSISCNSQYTGSRAAADIEWIGFDAAPAAKGTDR